MIASRWDAFASEISLPFKRSWCAPTAGMRIVQFRAKQSKIPRRKVVVKN